MVAAKTTLPVLGVPIPTRQLIALHPCRCPRGCRSPPSPSANPRHAGGRPARPLLRDGRPPPRLQGGGTGSRSGQHRRCRSRSPYCRPL
ncbi:hypothetical protein ACTG25_23820 [Aeromonas sp. 80P]